MVFSVSICGVFDVHGVGTRIDSLETTQKQIRFPSLLPRIDYYGGAEFGGVPDLRLGLFLYEQCQLFSRGQNSALLPLNLPELDLGQGNGESREDEDSVKKKPVKKFTFDDGTIIYYSEKNKTMLLLSKEKDGIFFVMETDDQVAV